MVRSSSATAPSCVTASVAPGVPSRSASRASSMPPAEGRTGRPRRGSRSAPRAIRRPGAGAMRARPHRHPAAGHRPRRAPAARGRRRRQCRVPTGRDGGSVRQPPPHRPRASRRRGDTARSRSACRPRICAPGIAISGPAGSCRDGLSLRLMRPIERRTRDGELPSRRRLGRLGELVLGQGARAGRQGRPRRPSRAPGRSPAAPRGSRPRRSCPRSTTANWPSACDASAPPRSRGVEADSMVVRVVDEGEADPDERLVGAQLDLAWRRRSPPSRRSVPIRPRARRAGQANRRVIVRRPRTGPSRSAVTVTEDGRVDDEVRGGRAIVVGVAEVSAVHDAADPVARPPRPPSRAAACRRRGPRRLSRPFSIVRPSLATRHPGDRLRAALHRRGPPSSRAPAPAPTRPGSVAAERRS